MVDDLEYVGLGRRGIMICWLGGKYSVMEFLENGRASRRFWEVVL
jgi:hypothetical protein